MGFKGKDFEALNKAAPSGRMDYSVDFELYWFHAIAQCNGLLFQSSGMHKHKFFELHFILGGSITYVTSNSRIRLEKGNYVMFEPGQGHKITEYSGDLIKCSAAFTVGVDEPLHSALLSKCGKHQTINDAIESSVRYISEISGKQSPYYGIIVKNRLFDIIHSISGDITPKKRREAQPKTIDGSDIRIFKIKRFVKDNPHVFLGCEDMAGYCDVSVKQLNRIFLKHEGLTLLEYIHSEKIRQAKRLLEERNGSVREISDDLGFSSVYYFIRFFSNHVGMTPGEYRENLTKAT